MSSARLAGASLLFSGASGRVLALLNADDEEARVTGGAVRNALLGLPVSDIDIATTAVPDEVMRRAHAAGIKCVPTGIAYGTVTLVIEGQPIEVTTLREDIETFGRKATVAFGRDWQRDAMRRDFTINGLSVDADGVIHDDVGGLADIDARRVRFIGDPAKRIEEDFLRILRFFRFHAAYGKDELDRDGLLACIKGRAGLVTLSAERIRKEMLKLLVADRALDVIVAMEDAGLIAAVTGGVAYRGPLGAMIAIEAALGVPADGVRRLGALTVAISEDAKRLSERLRLSNAEAKRLDAMGHRWWRMTGMDDAKSMRLLYRLGADTYRDRLMLAWARSGEPPQSARWHHLASLPERWSPPAFPLRSSDFLARGVASGPLLGQALGLAEDAWLAQGFPLEAPALDAIAEQVVTRVSQ